VTDPHADAGDTYGQIAPPPAGRLLRPPAGVAPHGEASGPPRPARRRRWLLAAVAALAAAPTWLPVQRHQPPRAPAHAGRTPAVHAPSTVAASTLPGSDVSPVHRDLTQLADQLTNAPYETQTGRYTHIDFRNWSFATSLLAVFDEQFWLTEDRSGREQRIRFPDQPAGTNPRWPTARPVRVDTEDFPAGGHSASLPDPPSANPGVLSAQLDTIDPRANGPQSVLRAIADLYRDTAPSTPVRAAILRLFADTPSLNPRGQLTDRAGRPGIAVSIDSDVRDLLIFDPHAGVLLAYEVTELVKPPGTILPVGAVRDSVLYLAAGRVDQYDTTPAPAAPADPWATARARPQQRHGRTAAVVDARRLVVSYLVEWGRDDTQPTGTHQLTVNTVEELDTVLDYIEQAGVAQIVDISPADDHQDVPYGLQIGIGPITRSFAVYIGHPAGALGYDPHLPPTHASIIFDYGGEPTPYDPNWLRLTPTQARQLAREYVRTGRRPTSVAWHP